MAPLQLQLSNSTLRRVIKRLHFPLEIMLVCVRWYAAYPLSLRQLEEMMAERGVGVDHATVHRWALKILPVLAAVFRQRKRPVGGSWRMDETYIQVSGQWKYLYRAVDRLGQTVDFLLTARGQRVNRGQRTAHRVAPVQVPEQHRRAGPPSDQTPAQAHAGVENFPHGAAPDCRHRDHAHDRQGADELPQGCKRFSC